MKTKRKNLIFNNYTFIILGILILIVFILSIYCFQKYSRDSQIPAISPQTRVKSIDELELKVFIPANYGYYVSMGTLHITKGESEITISLSGTMFPTMDDELAYLNTNNNVKIEKLEKLKDNFYKLRLVGKKTDTETIIYKYKTSSGMYTIESSSPDLYTDMDVIARSFIHVPKDTSSY